MSVNSWRNKAFGSVASVFVVTDIACYAFFAHRSELCGRIVAKHNYGLVGLRVMAHDLVDYLDGNVQMCPAIPASLISITIQFFIGLLLGFVMASKRYRQFSKSPDEFYFEILNPYLTINDKTARERPAMSATQILGDLILGYFFFGFCTAFCYCESFSPDIRNFDYSISNQVMNSLIIVLDAGLIGQTPALAVLIARWASVRFDSR